MKNIHVHANSLMARRSRKSEVVKGTLLMIGMCSIIALLFFASDYAAVKGATGNIIICDETATKCLLR